MSYVTLTFQPPISLNTLLRISYSACHKVDTEKKFNNLTIVMNMTFIEVEKFGIRSGNYDLLLIVFYHPLDEELAML